MYGLKKENLTVMFADIHSFTKLCGDISAECLVEMLNNFFDSMSEIVKKHGGEVIELAGDSLIASFKSDRNAASCSVEMLDVISQTKFSGVHLSVGIGFESGEVIRAEIGNGDLRKKALFGQTVALASKIESLTTSDQILVSERIADDLKESYRFELYTELLPKQFDKPIRVFELKHEL